MAIEDQAAASAITAQASDQADDAGFGLDAANFDARNFCEQPLGRVRDVPGIARWIGRGNAHERLGHLDQAGQAAIGTVGQSLAHQTRFRRQ
jgi:hypothetical protein